MAITYNIQYQYKRPEASRPEDYGQMDDLDPEPGEQLVVPDVGDTVMLRLTDENHRGMYKVLTRNFSYHISKEKNTKLCLINIVVTDVGSDEMGARLKE